MRSVCFLLSAALALSACGSGGTSPPPPTPTAPTLAVSPSAPSVWSGPITVRFISYYAAPVVSVDIGGLLSGPLPAATGLTLGTLPSTGAYMATVVFADGQTASAMLGLLSPSPLVVAIP